MRISAGEKVFICLFKQMFVCFYDQTIYIVQVPSVFPLFVFWPLPPAAATTEIDSELGHSLWEEF